MWKSKNFLGLIFYVKSILVILTSLMMCSIKEITFIKKLNGVSLDSKFFVVLGIFSFFLPLSDRMGTTKKGQRKPTKLPFPLFRQSVFFNKIALRKNYKVFAKNGNYQQLCRKKKKWKKRLTTMAHQSTCMKERCRFHRKIC